MKITLCGSLKFEKVFHEWNEKLTLAGHTVYCCPSSHAGVKDWYTEAQKQTLDLVHLSKIEESDAIFVLNVGGYVGESTRREIEWARIRQKKILALENLDIAIGSDPIYAHWPTMRPEPSTLPDGWGGRRPVDLPR